MFAYIKGSLEVKSKGYVVIDVSGIGYKIFMSEMAIEKLGAIGTITKVYTHYHVREDEISLYGFNTDEELRMFELLLSVSGIGAKSAIAMLSAITPSTFALAVITDDLVKLTQIPGIGKKTAQRLILELKDKLKTEEAVNKDTEVEINKAVKDDNKKKEAISALQVLGYSTKEIEKSIEDVEIDKLTVEDVIKKALFNLSVK